MANAINENLEDRWIVVREEVMAPEYRGIEHRVVMAVGGFGCNPYTIGQGVFVKNAIDGERWRIEGNEVERFATPDEVEQARKAGTK